ncbi:evC complex member EVC isoform X2 [Erinaceus europaeus]|uniref:EvC complex member EVC isoform X2 n=1 Tax=Erinaceus europaeus TaxID=9365 RepID=A0ABM3X6N3_ERIEU|nr:evC complex member EVC isoform X2 [Erinaceus europaeus]
MACGGDARLLLGRDEVLPVPALLGPGVLLGALLGLGLGLLLARRARPGLQDDTQSLLRNLEPRAPTPSEAGSPSGRRRRQTRRAREEPGLEERDAALSSPVTTFALKAKVVYPLKQKFRPLADGSSNPSLHETLRPALPHQPLEASPCSSLDSVSQRDKDASSSASSVPSASSEDRALRRSFLRPSGFLEALTRDGVDVHLCAYSLFLQDLLAVDAQLRHHKRLMYLQILKICLLEILPRKKPDDGICQKILAKQDQDLEELEERLQARLSHAEALGSGDSEYVTLADVERKEREISEQLIDYMEASWQQVGHTQHLLMEQFVSLGSRARQALATMTERMIVLEGRLRESQDLQVLDALDRMLGRAHLAQALEGLRLRLPEDTRCRLGATARALERLVAEGWLSGQLKEELLAGQHTAFWGEAERHRREFSRQAGEMLKVAQDQQAEGAAQLAAAQEDEREAFLAQMQLTTDPDGLLQAFHELLEAQWLARRELQDQHSLQAAEALAQLAQELHGAALGAFQELEEALFLRALPGASGLPGAECQALWREAGAAVAKQQGRAGGFRRQKRRLFRDLLAREEQLWLEELALAQLLQVQLREDQEDTVLRVLERLGGLSQEVTRGLLRGHELLLRSGLRLVALRGCAVTALTQMRLSGQKARLQELREQRAMEQGVGPCLEEDQWQRLRALEASMEEEDCRLQEEAQRARARLQEQVLAEASEVGRLLRVHTERALGLALRGRARTGPPGVQDTGDQSSLVDRAVESVYVTSAGVGRLVGAYHQQLERVVQEHNERTQQQLTALQEKPPAKPELRDKAAAAAQAPRQAVHQRLLAQRRRFLAQFSAHQRARLQAQGQRTQALELLETQLETELQRNRSGPRRRSPRPLPRRGRTPHPPRTRTLPRGAPPQDHSGMDMDQNFLWGAEGGSPASGTVSLWDKKVGRWIHPPSPCLSSSGSVSLLINEEGKQSLLHGHHQGWNPGPHVRGGSSALPAAPFPRTCSRLSSLRPEASPSPSSSSSWRWSEFWGRAPRLRGTCSQSTRPPTGPCHPR